MRFIKRSERKSPRVSLVLLDWSVRESFHLLDYLSRQSVPRDDFEVIIIEYYSRVSDALKEFEEQVDTWLILDMPENVYYHKHMMYNAGIVVANGDIIMIGDSDAMVKPTFIETIVRKFDDDPELAYHIDQFRNLRRDFYPFNYPSFADVLGEGCINNTGGQTSGVLDVEDPVHTRNYGACMCAKRADLIEIGGADMHIDYLGHICGPYDLTFRLINYGRREVWDMEEFMYHTWHPGQAGADNYLGPHDGKHMSTTALEALTSGRISPLAESDAIRLLRTGETDDADVALEKLIPSKAAKEWDLVYVAENASHLRWSDHKVPLGVHKGFRLVSELGRVFAYPMTERGKELHGQKQRPAYEGADEAEVKGKIDGETSAPMGIAYKLAGWYELAFRGLRSVYLRAQALPLPIPGFAKAVLGLLMLPVALIAALLFVPAPLIGKLRRARRMLPEQRNELGNLVATLHNMKVSGALADAGSKDLLVIVEGWRNSSFIRLLRFFGLVPPVAIRRLAGTESTEALLTELERSGWSGLLLVPSDLYHRCHVAIAASRAAKRLVVV